MSEDSDAGVQAIAELDHFEGEYAEFAVIDPETRESVTGVYPYIESAELPGDVSSGDVFEIVYDPETEEILSVEYSEGETKTQKTRNAEKLSKMMGDQSDSVESGIAELDHFEGEYVAFNLLNPETRDLKLGATPYIESDQVPDDAARGDVFEIVYDPDSEKIQSLTYSEEETKKQNARNAETLAELADDDVVTTPDGEEE